MDNPELLPSPLSVKLLNTEQSRALSADINEFENEVFGPDFQCSFQTIKPWVDSGALFHAVVSGTAVSGQPRIYSLASILLTSMASRNSLFRGEIADYELCPWTDCPEQSPPVIYFASIVSENRHDLSAIYKSLRKDVLRYLQHSGIRVTSGFSIAAGAAGMRHLTKSGFVKLKGLQYMDKYNLLHISNNTARTAFWSDLVSPIDSNFPNHTAFRIAPRQGNRRRKKESPSNKDNHADSPSAPGKRKAA